ncbi:MAG: Ig-like domain-containing protein, partial [Promethearchaeota archaeon]
VYSADISLENLIAGEYTIYINGTAFNCEDAQSNIVNLTIIPQSPTELGISIPSTIRILKEFEIRTTLKYMENETTIPFQIVYLNISIGLDSFLVNTITGVEGVSIHDYIISSEYEGQNITIQAAYEGQEKIGRSEISVTQIIYGKIPIILEFFEFPNNTARVGYSATYQVRIDIQDPGEALQNRIILFSSYYDNEISPFTTQQLYTDENGECGYTILELADGKNNITTYFEFLGSTTIAYNLSSRTDNILPKWNSSFSYNILDEDGDGAYRYGEVIIFNMTFWSPDIGAPSFSGLPVLFTFSYDSIPAVITQYVTGNNTIWYLFSIPDSFTGNTMNITIDFQGSNKVNNNTISFFITVDDKITAELIFDVSPAPRYILGAHAISVNLSTSDGDPLSSVILIFTLRDAHGNPIGNPVESTTNDNGIATVTIDFTNQGKSYYVTVDVDDTYGYYEVTTLTSEPIKVTTEFMAFIEDWGIYILIGAIVVVSAYLILIYGYKKPKQRKKRAFLKQMYQKLSDVENIQYCLILTKDGGIPVFSKSLAEVPIDETLISGFLSAISSFGVEIGSKIQKSEGGGLEELSYKQFKIIINEGNYVKVALLLLRRPQESLKKKLKSFNNIFEETYKERLVAFSGEMFDEVQVTKLMEESFETDLLYPHQVIQTRATNYIKESSRKDIPKKIV